MPITEIENNQKKHMNYPIILAYDRFENKPDPLTEIIQCLWNNDIDSIHRYTDSTLEFNVEATDKNDLDTKINQLHEQLSKIAFVRLSSPLLIKGEGKIGLDQGLQDYIKDKVVMGILTRPRGWNG